MPKRYIRRPDGTLVEYNGGSGGDISREEFDNLSEAIVDKADKTGWTANKYLGTDASGNMVEKEAPQTGTGGITEETDPTVPSWAKQQQKPTYTASEVGALPDTTKIPEATSDLKNDSGYITIAVATLINYYLKTETYAKTETYSQTEVDNLISGLDKRLNAIADSEDVDLDQLSEIVAYIKANKSLIDSITTSKVSIADIIDNLTTADAKKPLSAAQGKALKEMYDALPAWAKAANKPTYSKSEVGLGNVDNVQQYSASNPPPYPVSSVNDMTGAVMLNAGHVRARPETWMPSASEVGADPSGTADSKVSAHNVSETSHNDIRLLITGLTNRLNALANSTDDDLDQLAEIVAYIKANKSLIDGITTSKVSVVDIIDNLTTNASNKPLSAKMGVQLKALIDAIKIPTSLPASDVYAWAKEPQKPTYTAPEVGAATQKQVDDLSKAIADLGGKSVVDNAVGATFPTSQRPADADLDGYDIDIVNAMADDVFAYIDNVVSDVETVTKEIMGKDASGAYDIARYIYANREHLAWVKQNYPKMYAWKNGNTVKYTKSVSPRIDEKAFDFPYLHTVTTGGGEIVPAFTNLKDRCIYKYGQRYSLSGKVFKTLAGSSPGSGVIVPVTSSAATIVIRFKGTKQNANYNEWYGGATADAFTVEYTAAEADSYGILKPDSNGVYTATLTKDDGISYIIFNTGDGESSASDFDDFIITINEPIEYTTSGGGVEIEGGTPITAVSATRRSRTIGGVEYVRYSDGDVDPTVIYTDKDDDRNSGTSITKDGVTYNRYPLGDLGANRTKLIPIFIYANEHGYIPNHTYEGHETKMCALVAARFLRDLASDKQTENPLYKYIRENCMVVVIPVTNPFGYNINLTGGSGINSGDTASGYMNVNRCNINRNYDTPGWDYMHENDVVNDNWYGHYPGSQNETQYVMNTMVESGAVVAMSLHGHSGGANLGAIQGQDPDGTYFDVDSMSAISDFLEANYGYKLVDYDVGIEHKYTEVGAYNMPDVTCKSPSYITQCGAYGGIVEFSPFEADATLKVVTYGSTVIENAYAMTINLIAMWLSDYLDSQQ